MALHEIADAQPQPVALGHYPQTADRIGTIGGDMESEFIDRERQRFHYGLLILLAVGSVPEVGG